MNKGGDLIINLDDTDFNNTFHIMVKPRGAICNLNCEYCYYLQKKELYPNGSFKMSNSLMKFFSDAYVNAQISSEDPNPKEIIFGWQGGEPLLMGLDFFKKVVNYQKKFKSRRVKITNTLQTNGTLLTNDWAKLLAENNFLVGISIDGPPELHNFYRKDKNNKPSFERVLNGLNLLKKYNAEYNILACVHRANQDKPLEVYRFFRDKLGANFIQFIPIVQKERMENKTARPTTQTGITIDKLKESSVDPVKYGEFLIKIFDEWVQNDVGKVFIQIFDESLAAWYGERPSLCIFSPVCGNAMALEHNGDLYSCDHFVEPKHFLGNIKKKSFRELVKSDKQKEFAFKKYSTLPDECKNCKFLFICNGGCPKNRVTVDAADIKTTTPPKNYLCDGYKRFFSHIDPYMKYMSYQLRIKQPPANIMEYIKKEGLF